MYNFNKRPELTTIGRIMGRDQKIPKLFRTYNKRQIIEMIVGLALFFVRGIGVVFLIASLLDLYVFSNVYKVRNMATGDSYYVDRQEWKKYKQMLHEK